MTPPSGQELKPGNRTQPPRRRGYEDGGMEEKERGIHDDGKNKNERKPGTRMNKGRDLKAEVFV